MAYIYFMMLELRTLIFLYFLSLLVANKKQNKDVNELWDKLDHIISQLKNSPVGQPNKYPQVKTQAVKPALRIHQTGKVFSVHHTVDGISS